MTENASRVPPDFAVTYSWREGTVPPPYHYEYDIRLGAKGDGEIVFRPDYPGQNTPVWTERFAVPGEQLAKLHELIDATPIMRKKWREMKRPPVGGSTDSLEIVADGKQVSVPSYLSRRDAVALDKVYGAIRAIVPQELWDNLLARRAQYEREHEVPRT